MSTGPSTWRDFLALSGGELVSKAAGFVAFAYLARVLAPEAYGAAELAVALALCFGFVVDFGTGVIGAREVSRDRSRAEALAAQVPAARLLVALAAIPLMGLTAVAMGQPPETVQLVWLFALSLLAAPWRQQWLLQGVERMAWVSAGNATRMLVFALGVLLAVRGPDDLLAVGMVEIAASALLAIYFVAVQRRLVTRVRLSFSLPAIARLWREGLPLALNDVLWAATQYVPTMLVAGFVGGAALGWFGAAHRIVLSLWSFGWLYHFNLFPALTRSLAESPEAFQDLAQPSLRATAWFSVGGCLVGSLLADPLCRLVYGESFAASAPALSVMVWILPATLLAGHAHAALVAGGLQRLALYAQIGGAVVMIGGGVVLIPAAGPLGGAAAMVLSSCVAWAVSHHLASRLVAPMPLSGVILKPAAAAAATAAAVRAVGLESGWDAGVAGAAFCAAALLLDRRLPTDLRRLAGAKRG